ncbi:hypothetical protein [Halomonas sp. YLGW01]|uniref:hypothetical protein n=1 Tax=Halomonas sp. YLGW01 TaxID=2773308 RepID=UPI00177DF61B|nr:hypothetical protein [Halomonas sp. YLGW01]
MTERTSGELSADRVEEHSTVSGVFVNPDIAERFEKPKQKQVLPTLFTASDVCSSAAADAYFTDYRGAVQPLSFKKMKKGCG